MATKRTDYIKFNWMKDRQRFIAACAATILEAEIDQCNFWNEAEQFFKIAQESHLSSTIYGNPKQSQIKRSRELVYQSFKRDLKAVVYDKMVNSASREDYWD